MASAKQLAALTKARAARKKNLAKKSTTKTTRKPNPIKKRAPKKRAPREIAKKFVIKVITLDGRVGYFSGTRGSKYTWDTSIKNAANVGQALANQIIRKVIDSRLAGIHKIGAVRIKKL